MKAAAVDDPMARHRELHRSRRVDGYPSADGAFRIDGSFTPEAGVALWARVSADADRLARDAKKAGVPIESTAAYRADALVAQRASSTTRCGRTSAGASKARTPKVGA